MFVRFREKEEGRLVLERAVYAAEQKDRLLGYFHKHSQLVIPGVGESTCHCSDAYKRCRGLTWPSAAQHLVSPWVSLFISWCVTAWWRRIVTWVRHVLISCTALPHRSVGKGWAKHIFSSQAVCMHCSPGLLFPVVVGV